jgi:hypothetical protein
MSQIRRSAETVRSRHLSLRHGCQRVSATRAGAAAVRPTLLLRNRHPTPLIFPLVGRPAEVWPLRVCAGAFTPGTPHRNLWLSPDHAVFVDRDGEGAAPGVLVPVHYLINGATIVQECRDDVSYWHVELAARFEKMAAD